MKIRNGKVVMAIGVLHTVGGVSPLLFGRHFVRFAYRWFFRIDDGFLRIPQLMKGQIDHETFAAFFFFYFGLLLFPLGVLLEHVERGSSGIPRSFAWIYLLVVVVGAYMMPFSGMTLFMLPHAVYMVAARVPDVVEA